MRNIKYLIHYFITGILSLPKIIISIFIHFFIGIITILTIFPKFFITIFKNLINKQKITIPNQKKHFAIMGLSLCVYLVCIFIISRWSVQQLKIKYLSESIINSTDLILKEETITPPEDITINNGDNENTNDDNEKNDDDSNNTSDDTENNQTNSKPIYYPNDYWDYINVPFINVDFDSLINKNSDTVGWIQVNGTKVNYPVVQTTDNNYYLNHAFNKSKNAGGWVYADFRSDFINFEKNTIIYAHNLTNRTMFGSLVETQKSYWYTNPDNKYIKISTPTSNTVWAIFSTYTIEPTIDYIRTNFDNTNYLEFLNTMKARSIYDFGIEVNENDKILTLSTCNDAGTKRIVVQAKMVTINYR